MPNPAASVVISSFLRNQTSPSSACFPQLSLRELRRVPRRRGFRGGKPASLASPQRGAAQQTGEFVDQFAGDVEHGTIGDHVWSLGGERSCGENSLPRTPRPRWDRLDHPKYPCRRAHGPHLAEITSLQGSDLVQRTPCRACV